MRFVEALKIFEFDEIGPVNDGEVRSRYRRLAKVHHPDIGGDEEKFKKLNEAYQVLTRGEISLVEWAIRSDTANRRKEVKIVRFEDYYGELREYTCEGARGCKVYLDLCVKVILDNDVVEESYLLSTESGRDEFKISVDIKDDNYKGIKDIKVEVLGKTFEFDGVGMCIGFVTRYRKAKITVYVRRVPKNGKQS